VAIERGDGVLVDMLMDEQAIAAWLAAVPLRGGAARPAVLAGRLAAAPDGTGDDQCQAAVTVQMAGAAADAAARIRVLEAQIAAQPGQHIFTSLPRAGTVRAARLLAETGDCRARYPDPAAPAGAAGVSPVTRRSGTWISHHFRWDVNAHLRDALCDFAADSRRASPWAAGIYDAARARGKDHPHAVRILARAWAPVIWRCWRDGTAYDPAKHRALQDTLARQAAQQAAPTPPSPAPRTGRHH